MKKGGSLKLKVGVDRASSPLKLGFIMPTLRVELLKSREEDDKKRVIVGKGVAHSSRVSMLAGYPHHATKLHYSFTEPPKQRKDKAVTGKAPSAAKRVGKNEIHRSTLHDAFKGPTPHSPSESDSFSIKSSSSSSKSEADSIKKPSPPDNSVRKPTAASLSISLGSYLGAQAVEMWDVHHMPPSDFSKAIHEKLDGESKTLQDCFLEFKVSQGNMLDSHPRKKDSTTCANAVHVSGAGCERQHGSMDVEVLNEGQTHGLATSAFGSATAHSPETSSEASYHSGDTCNAPSIAQEIKHTQSIKELMGQAHQGAHKETGGLHAGHEPCRIGAHDRMQQECTHSNVEYLSQVTQDDHQFEKRSSCATQSEHDDGFSFEAMPISKGTHMQDTSSCIRASVDRSMYPGVVTDYRREVSVTVSSLEKYVFSTPLMGRSVSSALMHSERGKHLSSPGSLRHAHDVVKKVTRAEVRARTPPPVHEVRCKASLEEFTPVSPFSLGEDGNYQRLDEYSGNEYVDGTWFTTSKAQAPLHSPSKANWDWRSRSLGARASLKSAVRNLEAAFGGSRSVSLPKTRSQTKQREIKPESSKFMGRVFVSPAKARQKCTELSNPIQRLSYSGEHHIQEFMRSRREQPHTDEIKGEWAGSSHPILPSLPLSKQPKECEIPDFKVSRMPFGPTSRSVHYLTPMKKLSGHTSPLASTPPSSVMSLPNASTCMLQGYLQCIVRDGFACYTLSLKDSEEMLLARACTLGHPSSKEDRKWMYTFHSGKSKSRGKGANGWRNWLKKDNKSMSDLAGKMQVSSQLCSEVSLTGKRMQSLVSEFVLYDERNDDAVRSQSLRFLSPSNTCHNAFTPAESPLSARSVYEAIQSSILHQKQAPNIPRSPSSARMSLKSVNSNQAQPYSPLSGAPAHHQSSYSIDVWSDSDMTEPDVRCPGTCPVLHSELAAIVIKMPMDDTEMDDHESLTASTCRRSLKFSDDGCKGCQGDPHEKILQGATCESMMACGPKHGLVENRTTSEECVTMMLPKEHHGLPIGGVHGPTSLIERWRCGGKCDCGGWDLGCGMNIYSTQTCENITTAANHGNSIQSISHNQPLIIYSQGKPRNVLLNLSLVQEGYFILKFKNALSPLKAFAASIAILHSRESSIATNKSKNTENAMNQQCQANSDAIDYVSKGIEKPAFLEVCKEIPMWHPSNHSVSPYGRV